MPACGPALPVKRWGNGICDGRVAAATRQIQTGILGTRVTLVTVYLSIEFVLTGRTEPFLFTVFESFPGVQSQRESDVCIRMRGVSQLA